MYIFLFVVLELYINIDHSQYKEIVIMSQEDILHSTKVVIQGLEALKNEHSKMLDNILGSPQSTSINANKIEEKANLLRKSMDMIELGKFYFENIKYH